MTLLTFEVLDAGWNGFPGGETTVEDADDELVRLAGSAHAAGAIVVLEGLDDSHVQSQEDGEAANEAAQADGSWREGHNVQAAVDAVFHARQKAGADVEKAARTKAMEDALAGGADEEEAKAAYDEADVDPKAVFAAMDAVDPMKVPLPLSDGSDGPVEVLVAGELIAAHEEAARLAESEGGEAQ